MAPPSFLVLGIFAFVFLVGIEAQQTFQFSSFSQIPQALLDQLGSDQVENLRKSLSGGGGGGNGGNGGNGGDGGIQTYQVGGGGGGGSPGQQQTLQFSRFSQIPQSVLDNMPSDQIEQIKQALQGGNGYGGVQTYQVPGTPGQQGGGQPGQQQTFQFSSFSQIPQSLLDQLTSSQISNIRRELMQTNQPVQQIPQTQIPQNSQTLQFSKFSQIPQSVLDQFTSEQIQQIKIALQQGGGTVQLPATITSYSYTIPGGSNRRVNNALNTVFNYVAAGGYLTGVPPIDLLLLRFYIHMGPESFCG